MRTELPVFRRCCFCVPLRYGLLVWIYIKLIATSLLLIPITLNLYQMLQKYAGTSHEPSRNYAMINVGIILLFLCQIGFYIVFLVGGHRKSARHLRISYKYSFVMWILLCLGCLVLIVSATMRLLRSTTQDVLDLWFFIVDVAGLSMHIITEGYLLMLMRSEIVKLESNTVFQFVNNAANSECTMTDGEKTLPTAPSEHTENV